MAVDCEMSQKEDTLLYDFHVCLKNELLFESWVNILQELYLFVVFERSLLHLKFFLLYITLHFVAELSTQLIMVFQLEYCRLVLFKLNIFLLDFIYCYSNHIYHVTENGSTDYLY